MPFPKKPVSELKSPRVAGTITMISRNGKKYRRQFNGAKPVDMDRIMYRLIRHLNDETKMKATGMLELAQAAREIMRIQIEMSVRDLAIQKAVGDAGMAERMKYRLKQQERELFNRARALPGELMGDDGEMGTLMVGREKMVEREGKNGGDGDGSNEIGEEERGEPDDVSEDGDGER
jgi:hypothetical protein